MSQQQSASIAQQAQASATAQKQQEEQIALEKAQEIKDPINMVGMEMARSGLNGIGSYVSKKSGIKAFEGLGEAIKSKGFEGGFAHILGRAKSEISSKVSQAATKKFGAYAGGKNIPALKLQQKADGTMETLGEAADRQKKEIQQAAQDKLTNYYKQVVDSKDDIKDALSGELDSATGKVKDAAAGLADDAKGAASSAAGAAASAADAAAGAAPRAPFPATRATLFQRRRHWSAVRRVPSSFAIAPHAPALPCCATSSSSRALSAVSHVSPCCTSVVSCAIHCRRQAVGLRRASDGGSGAASPPNPFTDDDDGDGNAEEEEQEAALVVLVLPVCC